MQNFLLQYLFEFSPQFKKNIWGNVFKQKKIITSWIQTPGDKWLECFKLKIWSGKCPYYFI